MLKNGFSLVEVLVVIAIICLLAAFLFPVITTVRGNALRVSCGSNLRQVAIICQTYAQDNRGMLPEGNSANPGTFKFPMGEVLDVYMKENSIPPDIWYCPALNNSMKTPDAWMNPNTHWASHNEFPIGYFYVGNPSENSMHKFVKPVPRNINNRNAHVEFIFDYCTARRPSPVSGALVNEWTNFPHFSTTNPDGAQVLMGNFSVEYRNTGELTMGYKFVAPVNVYW